MRTMRQHEDDERQHEDEMQHEEDKGQTEEDERQHEDDERQYEEDEMQHEEVLLKCIQYVSLLLKAVMIKNDDVTADHTISDSELVG